MLCFHKNVYIYHFHTVYSFIYKDAKIIATNLLQSTCFQFNGLTCIIFSVTNPEVQIFFPQATGKVSAKVVVAQQIS